MQKIILLTCICLGIIGYFNPNSEIGEYIPQVEIAQTEEIEKYVEKTVLKGLRKFPDIAVKNHDFIVFKIYFTYHMP